MLDSEVRDSIRKTYLRFANTEAHGVSATYEAFALAAAESEAVIQFLSEMPPPKRQPNLLFGSICHLFGVPGSPEAFVETIQQYGDAIRDWMLVRSTQTNEPARCATLLPALCRLPQPLALLELGAASGLCLMPDRYAYCYNNSQTIEPSVSGDAPIFPCRANPATPIPSRVPWVVWRAGLDLNPIDLHNDEEVQWLESLIWPEQQDRTERLRAAVRIAKADPPAVERGDLLTDVRALAEKAPSDSTLVIFHSAVLGYVQFPETRERFAQEMGQLDAVWISNEAPGVFPAFLDKLEKSPPKNRFLLAVDGVPVAATGPHGQSIDWF